jgi:hypothetical protein
LGVKIFQASDGTLILRIPDIPGFRPLLVEINFRQYRELVSAFSWMPDICTAHGKIKAEENLQRWREFSKHPSETDED